MQSKQFTQSSRLQKGIVVLISDCIVKTIGQVIESCKLEDRKIEIKMQFKTAKAEAKGRMKKTKQAKLTFIPSGPAAPVVTK